MTARKRNARSYRVFRLESWEAFLQLITKPPYSNWAFRGERDERWPLYSSLSRYLQNFAVARDAWPEQEGRILDRKSTRLNSSHLGISYAVFCLKKKKKKKHKNKSTTQSQRNHHVVETPHSS